MGCDCRGKTAQCYRHLGYWAAAGARVRANCRLLGEVRRRQASQGCGTGTCLGMAKGSGPWCSASSSCSSRGRASPLWAPRVLPHV